MPELPEVETVVRDLQPLAGAVLEKIRLQDARVWFESELRPDAFAKQKLLAVHRRGKYIVWNFGNRHLVQHLRMTGKMLPAGSPALPEKIAKNPQIRLELLFDSGQKYFFFDTRRFGTFTAVRDLEKFWKKKAQAPDPLNAGETETALAYYLERIAGRDRPIKSALLDQTIIAGVGNIYADEALHREKIHPRTPTKKLSRADLEKIFYTVRGIFNEAIAERGTSAFNYLDAKGEPGSFAAFLRVYQRTGEICLTCKRSPIKSFKLAGRTSHFCPECQPLSKRKS